MNGIQNRSRIEAGWFMERLEKDVSGKEDLPVESQGSERIPLLFKHLLRERSLSAAGSTPWATVHV